MAGRAFSPEEEAELKALGKYGEACTQYLAMGGGADAHNACVRKFLSSGPPVATPSKSNRPPPVGEGRRQAKAKPAAPTDPELLIEADEVTGKQCSFYEALMWASENLHTKGLKPNSAPSSQAWSLWTTYSRDHQTQREFWNNFGKHLIPNKTEIEMQERFKDDGGIAEAIDEIRELSEQSMVEAFLLSRSEASYRQFTVPPETG